MHPVLIQRILKAGRIFSAFGEAEIASVAQRMFQNIRRVNKGDVVLFAGSSDAGNERLFVVLEGSLKVSVQSASFDREIVLNVLTEGAMFGELAMLDGEPRSADVTAMTDGVLGSIHRRDFFELAKSHPDMLEKVIQFLCREVRRLSRRFEQVASLSVRERLAAYLMALHATFKQGPVRMTQQELAGAIGATREQVSRIMSEFVRAGYLEKIDSDSKATPAAGRAGGKHGYVQVTAAGALALPKLALPADECV